MILNFNHFSCQNWEKGSPPPHVVILHGFLGDSSNWKTIAKTLSHKSNVSTLDLRNHGKSPISQQIGYFEMAEDVLQTLVAMNKQALIPVYSQKSPIVLLGHSMGGKVAMLVAQMISKGISTHSFPLAGLIVVDISPRRYEKLLFVDSVEPLHRLSIDDYHSRNAVEQALQGKINNPSMLKFLLKNIEIDRKTQRLKWKIPFPMLFEKRAFLHKDVLPKKPLSTPTLFIRGANSPYFGQSDIPLVHKYFTDVVVETVADAGHWVHAENPTKFLQCVEPFLKSSTK